MCIEDNGVGITKKDFIRYCKPFMSNDQETYKGLDLNIAISILENNGFYVEPEKDVGTIFKINMDLNSSKEIIIDSE